jgi:arabinogalactan oligomer / maltooligosaccharide transport system substrate-binding protein
MWFKVAWVRGLRLLFLLAWLMLLAGCQLLPSLAQESEPETLDGRILVWHSWNAADTAVLNGFITSFRQLHPDVTIVVVAYPANQLQQQYIQSTPLGFGPDLLIAPHEFLTPLHQANTIRNITDDLPEGYQQNFLPQSFDLGRVHDQLHALPLSLRPMALYYNRQLVPILPSNQTYDSLVLEASNGRPVGLNLEVSPSYMGIGAFGSDMFTATGALAADQTGLTNWLTWLSNNSQRNGVLLSQDGQLLRERFINGQLAYYTGFYDDWAELAAALNTDGETMVGVAPLPQGPFGQSRPLLWGEMMFFNPTSSDRQYEAALALAQFLANQEQSRRLMQQTKRVPANQLVRIDAAAYPEMAGFAAQGRTAVSIPTSFQPYVLGPATASMYTAVLSGVRTPTQAVCEYQANLIASIQNTTADLSACRPPTPTPSPTLTTTPQP